MSNARTSGVLYLPLSSYAGTADSLQVAQGDIHAQGGGTLLIDADFTVQDTYSVPSDVALKHQGGMFTLTTGVTLTINGKLEARPHQIFSGGTVSLGPGSVKRVHPEWWGYVPGATSDPNGVNQAALNAAMLNSASSGAPVWMCGRGVTTNVHGTITGQSGMRMKGHGGFIKIDTGLSAATNLLDLTGCSDFKIEDVNWDGACSTFTESDRSNNTINCPNISNARFVRVWARNGRFSNISGYGTDIIFDHCRGEMAGTHNLWCSTGGAGTSRFKVVGGTYLNAGRSALGHNIVIQAASANVDTGDDVFIGGGVSCDFPIASTHAGSNIFCAGNSAATNTTNKLTGLRLGHFRNRRAGNGNTTFSGASVQLSHMCPSAVIDGFQDSESQFDGIAVGSAGDCPDVTISNGAVWGCLSANGAGGNGVEVDASRCNLSNVTSYQNAGHGFFLAGRNDSTGKYTAGTGYHKGTALKAWGNGYNGITFPNAPNTELHNCDTWLNTLSGMAFQSSPNGYPVQGLRIRGGRSYLNSKYGLDTGAVYQVAVQGATNASPIVIQANNHLMPTGIQVVIANVGGNTAANGAWTITVVDSSHFSLNGSTGNGAYTSGGTATNNSRCEGIDVDGLDFLATDNGTDQPNTLGAWLHNTINATVPDRVRNSTGYNFGYQAVTAAKTASQANAGGTIGADATGGAFSVTLPKASLFPLYDELTIEKIDAGANAVTVTANGTDTINGAATKALSAQWQWATLRNTGTGWLARTGTG